MITGGFHSQPFREHFSDKDYSYALITPRLTEADDAGHQEYVQNALRFTLKSTKEFIYAADPKVLAPDNPYRVNQVAMLATARQIIRQIAGRSEARSDEGAEQVREAEHIAQEKEPRSRQTKGQDALDADYWRSHGQRAFYEGVDRALRGAMKSVPLFAAFVSFLLSAVASLGFTTNDVPADVELYTPNASQEASFAMEYIALGASGVRVGGVAGAATGVTYFVVTDNLDKPWAIRKPGFEPIDGDALNENLSEPWLQGKPKLFSGMLVRPAQIAGGITNSAQWPLLQDVTATPTNGAMRLDYSTNMIESGTAEFSFSGPALAASGASSIRVTLDIEKIDPSQPSYMLILAKGEAFSPDYNWVRSPIAWAPLNSGVQTVEIPITDQTGNANGNIAGDLKGIRFGVYRYGQNGQQPGNVKSARIVEIKVVKRSEARGIARVIAIAVATMLGLVASARAQIADVIFKNIDPQVGVGYELINTNPVPILAKNLKIRWFTQPGSTNDLATHQVVNNMFLPANSAPGAQYAFQPAATSNQTQVTVGAVLEQSVLDPTNNMTAAESSTNDWSYSAASGQDAPNGFWTTNGQTITYPAPTNGTVWGEFHPNLSTGGFTVSEVVVEVTVPAGMVVRVVGMANTGIIGTPVLVGTGQPQFVSFSLSPYPTSPKGGEQYLSAVYFIRNPDGQGDDPSDGDLPGAIVINGIWRVMRAEVRKTDAEAQTESRKSAESLYNNLMFAALLSPNAVFQEAAKNFFRHQIAANKGKTPKTRSEARVFSTADLKKAVVAALPGYQVEINSNELEISVGVVIPYRAVKGKKGVTAGDTKKAEFVWEKLGVVIEKISAQYPASNKVHQSSGIG